MNDFWVYFTFILTSLLVAWKAGKSYPLLYLFLFTFFLQYFFAPYMVYNKYRLLAVEMKVNQTQYFEYTVPALFSLFFGVFLFNRDLSLKKAINKIEPKLALNLGYLLLFISISVQFAVQIGFVVLSSIAYFTHYLRYVAAFCFLFSNSKIRYPIVIVIYLLLVFEALRGAVFIDFIIWSIYFFFVLALKFDFPLIARMGFILMGFLTLALIQTVKSDYRKVLWSTTDVKKARGGADELDIITAEIGERNSEDIQTDGAIRTFRRLNQGWHLSRVLNTVPKRVPFANGEEMFSDVISSILPRIFYQNKKTIHTNEKFRKYTGHKLAKGTSMTIGILGDFYVNFGRVGSLIMLFIFGGLVAILFRFFIDRYVMNDPINFVWIPFMFTYLIRADNDFYSFSNGLVKGFLIFLFFNYLKNTLWSKHSVSISNKLTY